jgi:catechol 2,3-dioxygenase-like lactoylglutathione lyase family enzyme
MIHHVTREITPSALAECVRFYGLLGFEQVPAPPAVADRAVWLESACTQIHLVPTPDATPERGHVAIVAGDYHATLARLAAEGFEVDPRREHWGSPRAFVRDPAGHQVELMAHPPE